MQIQHSHDRLLIHALKFLKQNLHIWNFHKIIDYLENNSQGKNISLITKVLNTVCKKQRKDLVSEIRNIRENIVKGGTKKPAVKKFTSLLDFIVKEANLSIMLTIRKS